MRFFNTIIVSASALAALVSAANPPIAFTDAPQGSIEVGQTFTLKYTGDENVPATILLKKGPTNHLQTVSTITTSATGGSFKWTVPKDIAPGGDYALQIIAGSDNNYWSIGAIAGGTAPSSTGSASSSASSALSSASSKISSLTSALSSATKTSAGTTTPSASRNSTSVSKPTLTSTSGSSTASSTSSATSGGAAAPSDSNGGAANLKSNAALVLGAVAAIAYLG